MGLGGFFLQADIPFPLLHLLLAAPLPLAPLAPQDQRDNDAQRAECPLNSRIVGDPCAELRESQADRSDHLSTFRAFFSPHQRTASPVSMTHMPVHISSITGSAAM